MDNFEKLYGKSLHFLSFRPRSEKELKDFLKKKKAGELISQRIIESLKNSKFLNDEEFALWWVEQRTRSKPKALRVIKMELLQKGIDKETIEKTLGENTESDLDRAKKIAENKIRKINIKDIKAPEKLFRFLASKGFDYDTIKEVIDQFFHK
jgi:regulatory protein